MIYELSQLQIDKIKAELERRRGLLVTRLDKLAEKKRAKRKGKKTVPGSIETSGTKVSVRASRTRTAKAAKTPEELNEEAIKAARKLGATDEQLRVMGLIK